MDDHKRINAGVFFKYLQEQASNDHRGIRIDHCGYRWQDGINKLAKLDQRIQGGLGAQGGY
jgi:hypothetical protein